MSIILTGHIRNSFDNDNLYDYIKLLVNKFNVDIYIHTWNIKQSNISWRQLELDETIINYDTIYNYFRELKNNIKVVIIEDSNEITLNGNLEGKISITKTPNVAWKNMWYSKNKLLEVIKNSNIDYKFVINTRFDIMCNTIKFNKNLSIEKINNFNNNDKVNFLFDNKCLGIDNYYFGKINIIYNIVNKFHLYLDDIVKKYPDEIHPEYILYYECNN